MAWTMLVVAGLLEVVWAVSLKRTEGFTRLWPSVLTIAAMIASFLLLARAMTHLPTGVAYAVWVGIGVVGAALVSATVMGERLSGVQVGFLALIAVGIVGLKLATPRQAGGAEPAGATPTVGG
ncbi:MAG: multidrug efflux SMR transporter [Phycisphaerales bacterium]